MSGITGLNSSALASLMQASGQGTSTSDTSSSSTPLTPLQRAQALAQAAAASGGANSPGEAMLVAQSEQSALGAELINALNSSDTSYGPAYDISSGVFDYSYGALADGASSSLLDQIGTSLSAAQQWTQIQTPDGTTPGESTSVAPEDQISYMQQVTTPDGTATQAARNTPNLGTIGTNSGRLVLLGSLSSDQSDVQTYKFNLQQAGQLHIEAPDPNSDDPTASLGDVHMQVLDSSGNVVADSDPSSGEAYLNYVKLDQTAIAGADMKAGSYTIKLSYNSDAPSDAKGDYSLFIESGTDPGRVTYYTDAQAPGSAAPSTSTNTTASTSNSASILSLFA